ncbi:MAG: hypothetical protein IPI51_06840 [Betaproteobacteria bacterium]|jgi:hypothetical protein|nr:hypothetical protein [Betaproteobacteria bacterium]MBK7515321.1 hypothetical protein [Betaproteobacteria bacterium]
MDKIRVITNRTMCFDGIATPPQTEVEVAPSTALDIVNSERGRLVDPNDAQRLRKWATVQGARRDFSSSY